MIASSPKVTMSLAMTFVWKLSLMMWITRWWGWWWWWWGCCGVWGGVSGVSGSSEWCGCGAGAESGAWLGQSQPQLPSAVQSAVSSQQRDRALNTPPLYRALQSAALQHRHHSVCSTMILQQVLIWLKSGCAGVWREQNPVKEAKWSNKLVRTS